MPHTDADAPGLANGSVPITMGSPRFETIEGGSYRVTRATFVGNDVLSSHTHDRTTFAVILAGGFDLSFSNAALRRRALRCVAGTVFTEPVGERHANSIVHAGASVLVIQPAPASEEETRPFRDLLDGVHCFAHGGVELAGRRLGRELAITDSVTPLAAEALVMEMMVTASRAIGSRARPPTRRPDWLRRAHEFIRDCFRKRLTLAQIARETGVSASHLAAVFRDVHGVSLGAYVRALRIDWAADRLAFGRESISRIALRAGYADQAHLTRAFKGSTGYTPAVWRAECRGRVGRRD
jgi:AraC family transcriptional regulator